MRKGKIHLHLANAAVDFANGLIIYRQRKILSKIWFSLSSSRMKSFASIKTKDCNSLILIKRLLTSIFVTLSIFILLFHIKTKKSSWFWKLRIFTIFTVNLSILILCKLSIYLKNDCWMQRSFERRRSLRKLQ